LRTISIIGQTINIAGNAGPVKAREGEAPAEPIIYLVLGGAWERDVLGLKKTDGCILLTAWIFKIEKSR